MDEEPIDKSIFVGGIAHTPERFQKQLRYLLQHDPEVREDFHRLLAGEPLEPLEKEA